MNKHIFEINNSDIVPIVKVKRLRVVGEADRKSLAALGPHVDASRFNTRLDFTNGYAQGSKVYAQDTIDEIRAQGVNLIEIDDGAFVPAGNIMKARNLTDDDRENFEAKTGRAMRSDFKAQVETCAGMVLATVSAETVIRRLSHPESAF